jgi:hypothetical protein
MNATIALLFLAQATPTCGPVEAGRLAAGASFAPAVLTFDHQPFDPATLAPAGLSGPSEAKSEIAPRDDDAGATQCAPAAPVIA